MIETLMFVGIGSLLTGGGVGGFLTKKLAKRIQPIQPIPVLSSSPSASVIQLSAEQFYELNYVCTKHLSSSEPHFVTSVNSNEIKLRSTTFQTK